jgi:hypothetical protein
VKSALNAPIQIAGRLGFIARRRFRFRNQALKPTLDLDLFSRR